MNNKIFNERLDATRALVTEHETRVNQGRCTSKEYQELSDNIVASLIALVDGVKKPLTDMLDKLGVEKCPVCSEHLIDDDMNICENCDYGVHEWCTGYTYNGDGEYPSESAYAICKTCYRPEDERQKAKDIIHGK